ncbi:SH3 domain-containing protein, partial [bacterium]|nr:SH3 domain-containing protein [bacterium]
MKSKYLLFLLMSFQISFSESGFIDDLIHDSKEDQSSYFDTKEVEEAPQELSEKQGIVKIGTKNLNVREKPYRASKILTKIDGGTLFRVLPSTKVVDEYISVFTPSLRPGFVHKDFIESIGLMVKPKVKNLRLRDGASLDSEVIGKVQGATRLKKL